LVLRPDNGLWGRPVAAGNQPAVHASAEDKPENFVMSLPDYSMRQLLEAGVHFGHQAHRWNPKMGNYIFGVRNNIHIIDLAQTVPMLHQALQAVSDTVAKGGRILFVGTKRQEVGSVLRQLALARRYADQLEDDLRIDRAAAQARGDALLQ
jgi:hypothetical protein